MPIRQLKPIAKQAETDIEAARKQYPPVRKLVLSRR